MLGEEGRNRRLPIIIGMFEAQAIAIEIEKITSSRPMTHDLFKSFAEAFAFNIEEIVISDLREGVFYAKIICIGSDAYKMVEIDARPSDAIAIGLRFGVPIYTYESIMSEAGIVLSDTEEGEPHQQARGQARAAGRQTYHQGRKSQLAHLLARATGNDAQRGHCRGRLRKGGQDPR